MSEVINVIRRQKCSTYYAKEVFLRLKIWLRKYIDTFLINNLSYKPEISFLTSNENLKYFCLCHALTSKNINSIYVFDSLELIRGIIV